MNFEELARCTDDFNGAQLKAVCVEAVSTYTCILIIYEKKIYIYYLLLISLIDILLFKNEFIKHVYFIVHKTFLMSVLTL